MSRGKKHTSHALTHMHTLPAVALAPAGVRDQVQVYLRVWGDGPMALRVTNGPCNLAFQGFRGTGAANGESDMGVDVEMDGATHELPTPSFAQQGGRGKSRDVSVTAPSSQGKRASTGGVRRDVQHGDVLEGRKGVQRGAGRGSSVFSTWRNSGREEGGEGLGDNESVTSRASGGMNGFLSSLGQVTREKDGQSTVSVEMERALCLFAREPMLACV